MLRSVIAGRAKSAAIGGRGVWHTGRHERDDADGQLA